MELAKRSPVRLAALLATLAAACWALFRRLKSQQPGSSSPSPSSPVGEAGSEQAAQTQEVHEVHNAVPATKEEPAVEAQPANSQEPTKSEPPTEEPVAREQPTDGQEPAKPEQPPQVNGTQAKQLVPPEDVALEVAENPKVAGWTAAVATLHGRGRETLDAGSAVKTSYVPDLSPTPVQSGLVLSKVHLLAIFGGVELSGLACLGLALALGFDARLGLAVMCVLVSMATLAILLISGPGPAPTSRAAEALHATAPVRHEAASAVWSAAVAWAQQAPPGCERGLAWRSGLAFLVEVAVKDGSSCAAFVLETGPLVVHHYVVRPGTTSSDAAEAAWGLRTFLAEAVPSGTAIADDAPRNASFGPSSVAPWRYSKVKVIASQRDGVRLSEAGSAELKEDAAGMSQEACIFVSAKNRMQKPWLGFGGSFTESSAVVFDAMTPEHQEEVLNAYFNPTTGAAFSIGRVSMGSCDFGLGNWTCGDLKSGDHSLKAFSIDHYQEKILPMYRRAAEIAGKPLWMLASPWSPPPWMKTKFQFNGDARLRPGCAKAWASHFVRFIKDMAEAGMRIMAVTVQNEPEAAQRWESCIYNSTEERDFVRDHLGPSLWEAGLSSVKVLIWDHNRDGMFERAQTAYADPEASKYIWGCAYHWYGDARFEAWPQRSEVHFADRQRDWNPIYEVKARLGLENVKRVAELAPDKHILFTEGCQELSGIPLEAIMNEWKFGERYAMNIIADINSGVEGWIDWNLFLNERGGPNHVENNCLAPIIYDTVEKKVIYTPPFYVLSHFSRYIKPGARRVLCSTSRDVLEITAFANPDETIAVVVLNQSPHQVDFKLKVGGGGTEPVMATPLHVPPCGLLTLIIE
uniref:Glucosylceramidase n=1 Tax=Alexandrium monilatum TaxID=311494 RepID=A0A7S4VUR1_9DINO|mmetsp:Transcript_85803/g.265675  ORF Transcript_85803/g.265675 Transcript_85803/m.265675 type:complete len:859 (-) Transcript_85803:62-2638(-)